jgi:predicted nucleic acid-binding protein
MIVLDASVAVKWLCSEVQTEIANDLLETSEQFAAPALIRMEVADAVVRRFRTGQVAEEAAKQICDKWHLLLDARFVALLPDQELFASAQQLAFQCKHTIADCLYLAAAKSLRCKLITADRDFWQRAKAVYEPSELLAHDA